MASFMVFAWCRVGIVKRVPSAGLPSSQSLQEKVGFSFCFFVFSFVCSLSVPMSVMAFCSTEDGVYRREGRREGGRKEKKIQGNSLLEYPLSPEDPSQSVFFF